MMQQALRTDPTSRKIAAALRLVGQRLVEAIDEKYINRSSIGADDLVEAMQAVADELDPTASRQAMQELRRKIKQHKFLVVNEPACLSRGLSVQDMRSKIEAYAFIRDEESLDYLIENGIEAWLITMYGDEQY